MRSLWFGILVCAAMFVACGDDDSDFATRPSDDSSSSVCEDCDDESSSSGKEVATNSSSSRNGKSSSSSVKSSSSVTLATPCKTEEEDNCEYGSLTDNRDGQTYKTVKIGDQWWMAENLDFEMDSSFCYNNVKSNCAKYGRLYSWASAMDSAGTWSTNGKDCGHKSLCLPTYPVRGVCPSGWHLPDTTEWNTLFTAVGDSSVAGPKLKSTSGWYRSGNGSDDFGFSAFPAGGRDFNGDYYAERYHATFWSSAKNGSYYAYHVSLYNDVDSVSLDYGNKLFGHSVRCVKDSDDDSSSSVTPESSSSSSSIKSSSSSEYIRVPCDVETDENCFEDARDGQTYRTVKIGDQVWMAENLNYAYTGVPYKYNQNSSDSISWCYGDAPANCNKYGRLYLWAAAMDSAGTWSMNGWGCGYSETRTCRPTYPVRGVCPDGWHLPTQAEWNTLFTAVGGKSVAGIKLKSTSGWNDDDGESGNGAGDFGFSALPAGYRHYYGDYYHEDIFAYFWSSTEGHSSVAYGMSLGYNSDDATLVYNQYKLSGFSVRCLQDYDDDSSSSVTPESSSSSSSIKSSSSSEYIRVPCDVETDENCFEDARDGQTYRTVKIGDQVWMAENLNFEMDESVCYHDSVEYCDKYGRLYTWAAAIDSAKLYNDKSIDCGYHKTCTLPDTVYGICPPGWHLPTQVEWKTLLTEVGGQSIAGKILKSQTGWYDNGNGTDDVGFSALPAGGRDAGNGDFYAGGRLANFWSASEDDSHTAYHMSLSYEDEHANLIGYQKNYGFSVRCLQD